MANGIADANRALMERVAGAFRDGDLRPMLEAIDDNVVWTESAPADFFRFGGTHRRRPGVIEVEALVFATYLFHRFDPVEIVTSGEIVWGLFRVEALHRPTDRMVKTDYAVRWRVRNGKIVEHQAFYDTAALLLQQGQLSVPRAPAAGPG
jgi:ketosteroid isomerase-like protein